MKKLFYSISAAILLMGVMACDGGTNMCIEEYNCSDIWCDRNPYNGCHEYYRERYERCLDDMDRVQREERPACYDAYDALNSCLFANTKCGESLDVYEHRKDSIEHNECRYESDRYYDICF